MMSGVPSHTCSALNDTKQQMESETLQTNTRSGIYFFSGLGLFFEGLLDGRFRASCSVTRCEDFSASTGFCSFLLSIIREYRSCSCPKGYKSNAAQLEEG